MGPSASRPRAGAATTSAQPPMARSSRSCRTVSTKPKPTRKRRTARRSGTPTSGVVATTIDAMDAGERTLRVKTKGDTMLTHPTHDRLVALGLTGMAKALEEQRKQLDIAALGFEERLALMVDHEAIERENKRLVRRLKFASPRPSA